MGLASARSSQRTSRVVIAGGSLDGSRVVKSSLSGSRRSVLAILVSCTSSSNSGDVSHGVLILATMVSAKMLATSC